MEAAHLLSAADVLRHFSVTAEGGLSPAQVTSARERYGPNGESAGRAGAAGAARAAVSVSPQHSGRGAVHPHIQLSASAGGQEARAPETSADALGAPGEAAWPPFRGGVRWGTGSGFGGRTPGSPSLSPYLQAQGPARSLQAEHLHRPHPLVQALAHSHRRSEMGP